MLHSGRSFMAPGDDCLVDLESLQTFDAFISAVNKTNRLWIRNVNVFTTNHSCPSYDGYIQFKCNIDSEKQSTPSHTITFCGKDVTPLTSIIESILCLPDMKLERAIAFSGPNEDYEDLILTPEQLHRIFDAHDSRSYSFWYLNLSPEQSVVLAAKTNMEGIWFCSLSDKGQALVHWLENHNEQRTLGSFSCQYYGAWENILEFTGRSSYPVFNQIVYDQFYVVNSDPYRYSLLVNANVNSISVLVNPYSFTNGECDVLLQALGNGTMVSPKIEFDFDADSSELDERLELFETGLHALFAAVSLPGCTLKGLDLKLETVRLSKSGLVFEEHIIDMLQQNKHLEALGLNCTVAPLQFPAIGILNAAAQHPRLRKLVFIPPPHLEPPALESFSPFPVWIQSHLDHCIQFHDWGRSSARHQTEKWQNYVFLSRFLLLQQVKEERIRSHLLVMALSNHSSAPQKVYFLLSWNVDVFAK